VEKKAGNEGAEVVDYVVDALLGKADDIRKRHNVPE
jgi:hypothetical protein